MITFINWMLIIPTFAQVAIKEDGSWMDLIHQIAESTGNEQTINNLFDELSQIHENPINLNRAKKEELARLPFLSDEQIEQILAYVYITGPMKSVYELKLVKELDLETIKLMLPFVFVGEPAPATGKTDWAKILRRGKSRIYWRFDNNLNQKEGYRFTDAPADTLNYSGPSYYSFLKYEFSAGDKIQAGFLLEKDPGERWRDGFESFHFLLKDIGRIKRLVAGDYDLIFGQGLVMNTGFVLGKSSVAFNTATRADGVARHFSTDELSYLRGISASYQLGKSLLTVFLSVKKVAASANDSVVTSFSSDYNFSTPNNLAKRNAETMSLFGVNWQRRFGKVFSLGITGLGYSFDKEVDPVLRRDNYFDFRGQGNRNLSVDYRYRTGHLFLFGEVALSVNGGTATLNGIRIRPTTRWSMGIMQRDYSRGYHAYYGAAFSESGRVQNERGLFLSTDWRPSDRLNLSAYIDLFYFPWLRYGVSGPSSGFENFFQVNYCLGDNLNVIFRYRYKEKNEDVSDEKSILYQIEPKNMHRFRWQFEYGKPGFIQYKSAIDYNRFCNNQESATEGFGITQSFSRHWRKIPLESDVQLMIFDAETYDNAIYTYEKSVLYSFSFPSFYGKGFRWMISNSYDVNFRLSFWLKIAQTSYFDRKIFGPGASLINGKRKSDLYFLLRYKF